MAHPANHKRNKDLVKMIDEGASMREAGRYFSLSVSTVHELYQKWSPIYGKKNVRVIHR